jgi:DNA-binding transcriptional ArsR family regulator
LIERPSGVGELARGLPVSRPAVSQHLKVLKDAGLLQGTIDGPRSCYCLDADALARLRRTLDARLGRFETACCDTPQPATETVP